MMDALSGLGTRSGYEHDMEEYDQTFKRWWDWGYTRILPPAKYELVKPHIVEKEKNNV